VSIRDQSRAFCERFQIRIPILLAPMAGASAPSLSIAVANAGGLSACGALLMPPEEIMHWAATVRASSNGGFQLNLWIPDPPPIRDVAHEKKVRSFLAGWGPEVPPSAGDPALPNFSAQCDALIEASPRAASSVMGVYPREYVARLKGSGIAWFAIASTVAEARIAEAAGADVIVAQGMEAGGHRASFEAASAERELVGLFSLLPAVVDAVHLPVVATGGIATRHRPVISPPWVAEYVGPRRGADLDVELAELLTREENLVGLRGSPLPAHRLLEARSPLSLARFEMVQNMV
jgi:nitronate monooxygenase